MNYFFFFFVLAFWGVAVFFSGHGRPLLPPSFMASKSSSVYTPVAPMYIYGFLPALSSLLCVASVEIFSRLDIIKTVNGIGAFSMPTLYRQNLYTNQVVIAEMSRYLDNYLYICIAKTQKSRKFPENSFQPLDCPIGHHYSYYSLIVQIFRHLEKETGTGETGSRMGSIGAKGDVYERKKNIKSEQSQRALH